MKNLLFIGSESYDAPTITVLEGLQKLGWNIYTLNKPNINSWFCNQVVNETSLPKIRFVLSNLHWGTRWSLYEKLDLLKCKKVLIDGDDDPNIGNWYKKYSWHCDRYPLNPPEEVRSEQLAPYRWMEDLGNYRPDYVFCSQKSFSDSSIYLPFGIHQKYYELSENRSLEERKYTFAHFPGPGQRRRYAVRAINAYNKIIRPSPRIWNQTIRGEFQAPPEIQHLIVQDKNVHSWHRWTMPKEYFKILNQSRVVIYPGVDHWPFWDSKRPWEAIACGAAVLMQLPTIDTQSRGLETLDSDFVFDGTIDLLRKIRCLQKLPIDEFNNKIQRFVGLAQKQFSSVNIARFFLQTIKEYDS